MEDLMFTSTQLGNAVIDATNAERLRIAAITSLPEAAGREKLALSIATTTSKSVDEARAALSNGSAHDAKSVSQQWDTVLARRGMTVVK